MDRRLDKAVELLEEAYADGMLSAESKQALLEAENLAQHVGDALGSQAASKNLFLVTILVDDSGSIAALEDVPDAPQLIRQGHNLLLDVLEQASGAEILVQTRYLNAGLISPYRPIRDATRLDNGNYAADGDKTPLYLQSVITLGSVIAKVRDEEARGATVRALTIIMTDGVNNSDSELSGQHVKALTTDMLEFATNHIVAGMGIGDEHYRDIFSAMGIPQRWILTAPANKDDIRRLFETVAKQLQLAAKSQAAFLELLAGPASDES